MLGDVILEQVHKANLLRRECRMGMYETFEMCIHCLRVEANELANRDVQLTRGTAIEFIQYVEMYAWVGGEDRGGECMQFSFADWVALADFLQGGVRHNHVVQNSLYAATVLHGL